MSKVNVRKLFLLTVLLFIVIFVVGISYAYTHALFYNRESNTTIAVQGGIMEIIYNDPETGGFSPNIVAEGVIPGWETTKIFTITGTNDTKTSQDIDTNMYYKIGLKVEENNFSENALTYSLKASNGDIIPTGQVVQDVNGYVPQTGIVWFGVGNFIQSKDKVVHKYELVVSFPETGENQNIDKGKRFAGYVIVQEETKLVNVNIKVNPDNPELNYTKKLLKNSTIILENPEREGHEFTGWNIVSGSATINGNKLTVGEDLNVEVEALWDRKEIILLLDLDGGTSDTIETNQVISINKGITLDVPTKEGYIFDKWILVSGDAIISGNTILTKETDLLIKATWIDVVPVFTYLKADGTNAEHSVIRDTNSLNNWRIRFLESGRLTFTELGNAVDGIDVFLVGGGGGGGSQRLGSSGGGGGGYTKTQGALDVRVNTSYEIIIGAGGAANSDGSPSSAFEVTAQGGKHGIGAGTWANAAGGAGGSGGGGALNIGGGRGGSDGSNGTKMPNGGAGGKGQGTSTREFWDLDQDTTARLYSGGGGGGFYQEGSYAAGGDGGGGRSGSGSSSGSPGVNNLGGGGGGGNTGGVGGSGIVVIRNHR